MEGARKDSKRKWLSEASTLIKQEQIEKKKIFNFILLAMNKRNNTMWNKWAYNIYIYKITEYV